MFYRTMNLIKGIWKGVFGSTAAISILAGGTTVTAIYTKPSKESFKPYFKNFLKHSVRAALKDQYTGLLELLLIKGEAYLTEKMCTYEITNYVIYNIAKVRLQDSNEPLYFIGAFGNWHFIDADADVDVD